MTRLASVLLIPVLIVLSADPDVVPPSIGEPEAISVTAVYSSNARIRVDITDSGSGVRNAILSYCVEPGEWVNVTMSRSVFGFFAADVPAFRYGTVVKYKILAEDNAENWAISDVYNYTVGDRTHPLVGVPELDPVTPYVDQSVLVRVNVTEPEGASGVEYVKLYYSINGKTFVSVDMSRDSGSEAWLGVIPSRNSSGQVTFYVQAFDRAGNSMKTKNLTYTVQEGIVSILLQIMLVGGVATGAILSIFYVARVRKRTKSSVKTREVA